MTKVGVLNYIIENGNRGERTLIDQINALH